ncbi:hypothetical protein D3C77_799450 [compost metagenome]
MTCPCNHEWRVSWNSWSSGKRCKECATSAKIKTITEIAEELRLGGCELYGEYYGSTKPFKYVCSCVNRSSI